MNEELHNSYMEYGCARPGYRNHQDEKKRNAAYEPQCMQGRVVMPYVMGAPIKSMDEAVLIMIR